ncbi:MAG: UspA domain protein [Frankiales bacterium]|nr:UspA domain protein [Frankiales bacterium]
MNRIIVGVDAGPAGVAAMQWALREAVSRQVPLHAVRAWSPSAYAMEYSAYVSYEVEPQERFVAQALADEQLKLAVDQVPGADTVTCTAAAVQGSAAHVLVEESATASMVVVGSRSHGVLSRAVLGSVSSSVLHHATVPVTVVPEPHEHDGRPGRVLVGVDHSPSSVVALATAAEQARRHGMTLVPVYAHEPVYGDVAGLGISSPDPATLEEVERRTLELAAKVAGGVDVDAEVVVGHPAATLKLMARPQDLLVVGSRGRGGFKGLLLGSTSTQCVQHATCPVLVVRS